MIQTTYYHATLYLHGSLLVTKDEQRGGVKVAVGLGDTRVPIGVKRKLAAILEAKPPEGELGVIVLPRTYKEGRLGNGTQLALCNIACDTLPLNTGGSYGPIRQLAR